MMYTFSRQTNRFRTLFYLLLIVTFAALVFASPPVWVGSGVNYSAPEDSVYNHNLTLNITGFNNDVTFAFDTETPVVWENASGATNVTASSLSNWITILNASLGNLVINATQDNQTGFFRIPIQATNDTDATVATFEFMVNATNDVPNLTSYQTTYNLTENQPFLEYFNATDEESHFPLWFNLTFVTNCTHASWSGRNEGENCTLFNATSYSNESAQLNYTPTTNDVGTYWAWLSVQDAGESYSCPHAYCVNSSYESNQTSSTSLVKFNILTTLQVNVSNCSGQTLQEGSQFNCSVEVRTMGETDSFNASTYASFANGYGGPISNRSWFFPNETNATVNFSRTLNISLTPTKREVGNWTINFSVVDEGDLSDVEAITLFVNWTEESVTLDPIANLTLYENNTFTINASDNDLLIQDKLTKNENLTFQSNTSWVTIQGTQTISGNNYTTATIHVDHDSISSMGNANYSILINVTETGGSSSQQIFNIEILNDTPAQWNLSKSNISLSNETENVYINLSEYVSDPEGDTITFSYTNDSQFDNFNLTSSGIVNFTSTNVDVGEHIITFNASDGKLDSLRSFNFTIYNVVDNVSINSFPSTVVAAEDNITELTLNIYDDDFLIPDSQKSFYNETLTVALSFENLTEVTSMISFDFNLSVRLGNLSTYIANFTPNSSHIGNYNVTINVSDAGGTFDVHYFTLNITSVNDEPILSTISNQTIIVGDTIYLDVNATDEEDSPTLPENGNLTYVLTNLTTGGNFLSINATTGVINFTLNSSHIGYWDYNVSVNDTAGAIDWQIFSVTVFGAPNITAPASDYVFNWSEGNATGNIPFEVDYGINNTNLTYLIYMDRIVFSNATDYNYTTLIESGSLRNQTNFTWNSQTNFTWNYTLGYDDETYDLLKNITLVVFNPDYPTLNDSVTWKANVTHTNQALTFKGTNITDKGPVTAGNNILINLSEYFEDADYWDLNRSQTVNFTITTVSGSGYIKAGSTIGADWILTLGSPVATTETIRIDGFEYNDSNASIGNASSNTFQVEFTEKTTTSSPSSGGGGGGSGQTTVLQHFSLKVIVPQKVEISDKNYIDVGFSVRNSGQVALTGIDLSSTVTYDGTYSDVVNISLPEAYIPFLGIGESQDFSMRINADTQRSGRYKATVFANVTSPKLSDWGDFFIDLNEINESEASQLLVFTEKIVSENPECIELTENLEASRELFSKGEYDEFKAAATKIIQACEDSIATNEQVRYPFNIVQDNFYYISFSTLVIFFAGFIFYVYKRVRFNKYRVDDYIRGEHV